MIDELITFLLAEIAMDGDEGVPFQRLQELIKHYYEKHVSDSKQNVDASFVIYVIDKLRLIPETRLGFLRPIDSVDEEIKDNKKDARKNITNVFQQVAPEQGAMSSADIVSSSNELRVAVDHETTWFALTSSHDKLNKLTPWVWQILQSISRGRENGKTVVQLGKEFTHDQKSLFYFTKVLLGLNLIAKIPFVTEQQVRTSLLIHIRYAPTSIHYLKYREADKQPAGGADDELRFTSIPYETIVVNAPLVKSRIVRVLQAANKSDYTHPQREIFRLVGFPSAPTTPQRRALGRLIDSMATEGIVEKVTASIKGISAPALCLKLKHSMNEPAAVPEEGDTSTEQPFGTLSMEKQLLDLLLSAGSNGMTIKECSWALGNLNVRVVESLLNRLEAQSLPKNMQDYTIRSYREVSNKEQRRRYFSLQGYLAACKALGTSSDPSTGPNFDPKDLVTDPDSVGGFEDDFEPAQYKTTVELDLYLAKHFSTFKSRPSKMARSSEFPKKRGRPRKAESSSSKKRPKRDYQRLRSQTLTRRELDRSSQSKITSGNDGAEAQRSENDIPEDREVPLNLSAANVSASGRPKRSTRIKTEATIPTFENQLESDISGDDESDVSEFVGKEDQLLSPRPINIEPDSEKNVTESMKVEQKPRKRKAPETKKKLTNRMNATEIQRSNSLLELLDSMGGIANVLDLQNAFHSRCRQDSGVTVDRTTVKKIFDNVLSSGSVKETSAPTDNIRGSNTKNIIFRSDIEPSSQKMSDFLRANQKSSQGSTRALPHVGQLKNTDEIEVQIIGESGHDEHAKNDNTKTQGFKADFRAVSQYYGAPPGIFRRAQSLHTFLLEQWRKNSFPSTADKELFLETDPPTFHRSYLAKKLPLSVYLSIVPQNVYDQRITVASQDPVLADTVVDELDSQLRSALEINSHRAAKKLDQVLDILRRLKLIIPLNRKVEAALAGTIELEAAVGDSYASYWKLHDIGPVYQFAKPGSEKPLVTVYSLPTLHATEKFWEKLENCCLSDSSDLASVEPPILPDKSPFFPSTIEAPESFISSVVSAQKWMKPSLTSPQRDVIASSAHAIDLGNDEELENLLRETLAPPDLLRELVQYVQKNGAPPSLQTSRKKASKTKHQPTETKQDPNDRKLAKHTLKKEKEWKGISQGLDDKFKLEAHEKGALGIAYRWYISPDGLSLEQLESLLTGWVETASCGQVSSLANFLNENVPSGERPLEESNTENEKHGRSNSGANPKKTMPKKETRYRFQPSDDSLLEDAYVVVKVRAEVLGKQMSWKDINSLFQEANPSVLKNHAKIYLQKPHQAKYIDMLKQEWKRTWSQYKDSLTDLAPDSVTGFGILHHVEFLREKVNKITHRARAQEPDEAVISEAIDLPNDISKAPAAWTIEKYGQNTLKAKNWDFVWTPTTTIARSTFLQGAAFTTGQSRPSFISPEDSGLLDYTMNVVAIKMILSTSSSVYNSEDARSFLSRFSASDEILNHLLKERVIVSTGKAARQQDGQGRPYEYAQQSFLSYFDEQTPREIVKNAQEMINALKDANEEEVWSLYAGSGDMFALAHLVSNHKVHISVDTSVSAPNRPLDTSNTRKMTDENFENAVIVRICDSVKMPDFGEPEIMKTCVEDQIDEEMATDITAKLLKDQAPETKVLLIDFVDQVRNSGPGGFAIQDIKTLYSRDQLELVLHFVDKLIHMKPAILFWATLENMRVIHAIYRSSWTVRMSNGNLLNPVFWLDMYGNIVTDMWQKAAAYVWMLIANHPGTTLHLLRTRIIGSSKHLLLPHELISILENLSTAGLLRTERHETQPFGLPGDLSSWQWYDWRYFVEILVPCD